MRESAVMLIINQEGYILGVSRKFDHSKFGLPGGKKNKFETPKECAIRETNEETGIKVSSCEFICNRIEKIYSNSFFKPFIDVIEWICNKLKFHNVFSFCTHCFYASEWDGIPTKSEEGIVKWISKEELLQGSFPEYNKNAIKTFERLYSKIYIREDRISKFEFK